MASRRDAAAHLLLLYPLGVSAPVGFTHKKGFEVITRTLTGLSCAALLVLGSGCAIQAPPYQPSINNVSALKRDTTQSVSVGKFAPPATPGAAASIGLRGSSMSSPVGASFADYLASALQAELALAQRFDSGSKVNVSGALLATDVDTAIGTASGFIEARFVVTRDGQVRFDKVKRGTHQWDSSFAAAVAVPAAQNAYPVIVQNLLSNLFSDADFLSALK